MPDSWHDPLSDGTPLIERRKFPADLCHAVVREILPALTPLCEPDCLRICGSLRRRKPEVGDIEIVFVPKLRVMQPELRDLFGEVHTPAKTEPQTAALLDDLVSRRVLSQRLKADGSPTWGRWNRLAVHVESGIPIDFFGCAPVAWWNILVCRTGGSLSNLAIADAAIAKGWRWEPGAETPGFRRQVGLSIERHHVQSEREVFEFVGLPYREPWERA